MGDACTGAATFTSFTTSTEQTFSVSQSTSRSLSVQDASTIDINLTLSGAEFVTQSVIPGATETVDVPVEITVPVQRVVTVPVLTLFAPCSTSDPPTSSRTPTPSPDTSSAPVSSSRESTPTSDAQTTETTPRNSGSSSASVPGSSSNRQDPTPTPTPSGSGSSNNNNPSETGTIITTTTVGSTTLPNGSQSIYVATLTTSLAPNGTLNDNGNTGSSGGGGSTRAVAIGVGVAGGIVALIILVMGITWHIRRKRRNTLDLDENVWGPDHEPKAQSPRPAVIPEYSYNPYGEGRTTAYAPVPTMSPPRARPMSLSASGHTPQGSTADEILYEAARQDLPRSRTASTTTRGYGSLTASSHMTHSARSDSVVGLLETHSEGRPDAHGRVVDHDEERPSSPVSITAPKLSIANPDADKDH
ncbi:hypothetical protein RhiJN_27603 [Ceratobasidium sp. AG-Ba]|nr:hypothetical protein RhiJN_27603 [Ceratobasidium sp. AG-Ba]